MASKIFLDANILLDFVLKRNDYDAAKKLVEFTVKGQLQAFVTSSVVHILGYWLTKAYGKGKAKELLLTLLVDIQVIDISHEIVLNALNSRIDDIEDALQYYTALHHKLDFFITRDKPLQKAAIAALPVCPPEAFLRDLTNE